MNAAVELLAHDGTAIAGGWSYDELRERAHAIAASLEIEPGTRVLLHAPNTAETIAAWFGILLAGGIVVATMPLLRAGEIAKVVEKAQVSHAIVAGALAGEIGPLDVRVLEELPTSGSFEPVDTAADDVAIIAFTSGTTGVPKGCMHFHRDLLATCDTFAREILDPQPDDVYSGTPPLAFTFGLGAAVLFPFRFGAVDGAGGQAARPARDAPPRRRDHAVHRADRVPGTAARGRSRLAAHVRLGRRAAARGRVGRRGTRRPASASSTGSARPRCCTSSSPPGRRRRRPARAGGRCRATRRGSSARTWRRSRPVEVGKLAVRGPTGCRYLDDERQTVYVRDGWNLTGDAFSMDADGYFWFQARTDDMIISSGYNISGFEVEAALLEHPKVAECAVVAAPDDERGHIVMAYVVASEPVAARELQDHVKERIAPYKYPRRIKFLDALPRTPTGKVQRNVLRGRVS